MANIRMQTRRKPGAMVRAAKKCQVRNTKRLVEQVNEAAHRTRKATVMAMKTAVHRLLSRRPHVRPYIPVGKNKECGLNIQTH